MIQQVNNMSVRDGNVHESDIAYLREYYATHGHFPVFQQVLVETRTDCNNNCPFCPHAFNKKPLGIMTWECYITIIDQLVSIGYNGRVALMLSNEPLLEDRLEDDYRGDRDKNPEKWSSNIELVHDAYGNNPKVYFKKRSFDEKLPNYAGNIPQEFEKEDFGFCNYPFRKLTIAYNGDILLCCDDFMYDTCFGNVMKDSLIDSWNAKLYNDYRLALLNNRRIGLCSACNESLHLEISQYLASIVA